MIKAQVNIVELKKLFHVYSLMINLSYITNRQSPFHCKALVREYRPDFGLFSPIRLGDWSGLLQIG
jgi:hypothetical protein